jgi:hypothetical protein
MPSLVKHMANTVAETLPRERTAGAPTAAGVAAFSMPGDVPEKMHPATREALHEIAGAVGRAAPKGVEAVVAYTPVSWRRQPSEVQLYTFARPGQDQWETVEPMARALAPIMGVVPILPVTDPVDADAWRRCADKKEGPGWRHVTGRGVLLYSAENPMVV